MAKTESRENLEYSIAIINLNMADTIEESLRSILDQVEGDKRFEVLVVDDGSTDGSQQILDKLADEYNQFRWKEGNNKNRGEARRQSVNESKAEKVIWGLDCDDRHEEKLSSVVELYVEIDEKTVRPLHLTLDGVNITHKTILDQHNFRDIHRLEDVDLERRIMFDDSFESLNIDGRKIWHEIKTEDKFADKGRKERLSLNYRNMKGRFIAGVSYLSVMRTEIGRLKDEYVIDIPINIVLSPLCYLDAYFEGIETLGKPEKYVVYPSKYSKPKNRSEIENIYNLDTQKTFIDEIFGQRDE